MAWNRGATLVTVLLFLAFGFEVIGVFSEPVSRNKLSIASHKGYDYGVLGYCPTDGSKNCSKAGLGYELQDSRDFSFSKSAQHTLTQLFIAHVVAAGCLLISFGLGIVSHFTRLGFYVFLEVWLTLIFLLTVLVFVVEIILFGKRLKFAGWFALVAAILTLIAVFALGFVHRSLRSSLGQTHVEPSDADPLFGNIVTNPKGSDFIVGRDDEKRPQVNANAVPFQSFVPPKPPALKSVNVQQGYERIPDSTSEHVPHSVKSKASRDDYRSDARQGQQPPGQAAWAAAGGANAPRGPQGAVRAQAPQTYQRQAPQLQSQGPGAGLPNAGLPNAGPSNAGVPNAGVPNAGLPNAGLSKAGLPNAGLPNAGVPNAGAPSAAVLAAGLPQKPKTGGGVPRSQREGTWSQIALQHANEQGANEQNAQRTAGGRHGPQDSVASSQAARIPAGAYIPGVDSGSRGYGPNVVKIPKVREPEHAVLDYYQEEAEPRPQVGAQGAKVPNYSRMSADGAPVAPPHDAPDARPAGLPARPPQAPSTPQKMNPMLQRYVESVPATPQRAEEPFYDVPNLRMVSESPAGSEASHYTSISERHARNVATQTLPPTPPAIASAARQWAATNAQNANVPPAARPPGPAQYTPAQQYRPAPPAAQQYAPQHQYMPAQQYAPPQQYAPHAQYAPHQQYAPQQQYMPPQQQQQFVPQQPGYISPAKAPRPAVQQRSEFALNNNPDFSLGNVGNRRRRPNRGPVV